MIMARTDIFKGSLNFIVDVFFFQKIFFYDDGLGRKKTRHSSDRVVFFYNLKTYNLNRSEKHFYKMSVRTNMHLRHRDIRIW